MARGLRIGLLGLLTMLAIFAIGSIVLLVIALAWPAAWPEGLSVATAVPTFSLPTATLWARLVYCAQNGVIALLLALVLVPLYRIVLSVARGAPFTDGNVRHFRIIAATFAIVAIGQIVLPIRWSLYAPFIGTHDIQGAVMAMLALILAEIFREGTRLREDSDLAV